MATRIDIEITSDLGDGTLTWRAAGAKQPKGLFPASLLPKGTSVGDVLTAEAEYTVDGPELISLVAPKAAKAESLGRLEILGSDKPSGGVTTELASKGRRGGRSGGGGGRGRGDGPWDGRGRGDGPRGRGGNSPRGRGDRGRPGGGGRPAPIRASRDQREAWIASLPDTRRAVAEQLMHEGRDGVASTLERQNKAAIADGRETIDVGPIMRIADELAPALHAAEWQDKAAAAIASADSADVRELRRTYIEATGHVDAEMLASLRTKLSSRIDRDHAAWLRELREAIDEGRTVRALQRSGRPVKAGAPLPDDLVGRLTSAAASALDPEEEADHWATVIEALANSPIRRLIRPESIPEGKDDELIDTIERLGHLVPGVADAFGIKPAPPRRDRGRNRS